jgi:hypothetical protein
VKFCALAVALLALAGCKRGANLDTKEAVRQGVVDYLATRSNLNMTSMNVEVTAVSFKQNEAEATVTFAPKGSKGQPISLNYTLERKGDHWVVKPRAAGQSPHGGMPSGDNPHGAMPPGAAATPEGGAMPPSHPPVQKQ